MASAQTVRAAFAIVTMLLIGGVLAGAALGQVSTPTQPPIAPDPTAGAGDRGGWIVASVLILGLLVVIGAVVKLYDLRGKREAEAVHLQAQISDAFLRDANLFGLPVAATAHAPLWKGTPVTIDITGEVPDPMLREAVFRIAASEAARIRPDVEIVDKLAVRASARAA
ncbi:MAG: hypothetical protein ACREKH_10100 [Candidatus Rokuibacteriota bacterium]